MVGGIEEVSDDMRIHGEEYIKIKFYVLHTQCQTSRH